MPVRRDFRHANKPYRSALQSRFINTVYPAFINFVTKNNKGVGRGLNNFVSLKGRGGEAYLKVGLDGL